MDFSQVNRSFVGGGAQTSNISVTNYSGAAAVNVSVDGNPVILNANYGSVASISNAIQSQLNSSNSGQYTVSTSGSAVLITKNASASNAAAAATLSASGGTNAAEFSAVSQTPGQLATTATKAGFSVDGLAVVLTANHSGNAGGLIADIQSQLDAQTNGNPVYSVSGDASGLSFVKIGEIAAPRLSGFSGTGATVFAQAPAQTLTLGSGDFNVQVDSGPVKSVTSSFATAEALAAAVNATGLDFYASIDPDAGTLEISSNLGITLSGSQVGGVLGFGSLSSTSAGSLLNASVRDVKNAAATMQRIDGSLTTVSAARSRYGAMQNLIESMIANMRTLAVQTSSARGRIVDADFAVETSQLLRSQILQQAGVAMLAQAQSGPRFVLQLLR